jgi:hypothetical protein
MGSWSVYCGISNITISSGRRCVFLPLVKNKTSEYDEYIPATLPIFGEYNDYGSLENIVEDFNTKIIEEAYGCSIDEFVDFLVDVRRDYDSEYSDWEGKEHLKPLESFEYMWIDGEVYDFLRNLHPIDYGRAGDFDIGNPNLLGELGFVHMGESGIERYNQKYVYTKDDVVVELVSDGTWAHYQDNKGEFNQLVYHMGTLKELGVDVSKFENMEEQNAHRVFDIETKFINLGYVIGIRRDFFSSFKLFHMLNDITTEDVDKGFWEKQLHLAPVIRKYGELIGTSDELCDRLADLVTIKKNMYSGSYTWTPMVWYITPQCGEYNIHQLLLEGFAKINKVNTYEEDEGE